jgi:hypothetical protein
MPLAGRLTYVFFVFAYPLAGVRWAVGRLQQRHWRYHARMLQRIRLPGPAFAVLAVISLAMLAGCQTASTKSVPPPDLRLLQSAPLVIPADCQVTGSVVVSFIVTTSGRPGEIAAAAPPCAQQALVSWVESFRYAPPAAATPAAIEWLMVSAQRGT